MAAQSLRRYLQPAPTLRWHPWAPLAFGLLCLIIVFYLGAQWGYAAAKRAHRAYLFAVPAAREMDALIAERWPARALMFEASAFDAAVMSEARRGSVTRWDSLRDEVEAAIFPDRIRQAVPSRKDIARLAELRLRNWSAASPRWRNTSTYCEEMAGMKRDLVPYYGPLAAAYSDVLGRAVSAESLAPAVPGWKCPASSALPK